MNLEQTKDKKILDLENYYRSPQLTDVTISFNGSSFKRNMEFEQLQTFDTETRHLYLIEESGENDTTIIHQFEVDGFWIPFTLNQIKQFRIAIGNLRYNNVKAIIDHRKNINNLTTIESVENYDITQNFLINQTITII